MKRTKFNKYAQYALLALLTIGASLTLGLLSMSGFYAVIPMVSLGVASFALSIMYEGEIYFANLRDALARITQKDYHRLEHSKRFLELVLEQTAEHELPAFLKEYKKLKKGRSTCNHDKSHANPATEKRLKLMERYFMKALFEKDEANTSELYLELQSFLEGVEVTEHKEPLNKAKLLEQEAFRAKWTKRAFYLSMVTGAFFGLGTIFLLSEAATILALSAATVAILPYAIIPLCAISALAYGFLIYNTAANIIQNDSLRQWAREIKEDFMHKPSFASVVRGVGAVLLISMGLALTIFTAGTWWSVANNVPKAFPFLKKIPKLITAVFVPLFTCIGALLFNMENTRASMSLFRPKKNALSPESETSDSERKKSSALEVLRAITAHLKNTFIKDFITPLVELRNKETFWQFYNPFRALVNLIEFPIKIVAFLGHLISIGATTDQIPGVPKLLAMICSAVSEGLEDFHYFFSFGHDHEHEHGHGGHNHDHSNDFPSKLIKVALSPLFLLSALWNVATSNDSFASSWHKSWNHNWNPNEEKRPQHTLDSLDYCQTIESKKIVEARSNSVSLALANMQLKEQSEDYQSVPEKQTVYQELNEVLVKQQSAKDGVSALNQTLEDNGAAKLKVLQSQRSRFFQPKTTSSEDFVVNVKDTLNFV